MRNILGFLALSVLLAAVACGGGLDLDDYAEECYDWEDDYRSISDLGDAEDALEDWKAIKPPGDVNTLHNIRTDALELSIAYLEKQEEFDENVAELMEKRDESRRAERDEIDDEIEDLKDDFEDETEDLLDEFEGLRDDARDEWDDLPPRVQREVSNEGCDLDDLDG